MPPTFPRAVTPPDRTALRARFERDRARTRALFDLIDESAYGSRPIPLRNPVVFYEGHLPAFAVNTLVKRALGRAGVDDHFETIFARGIDPEAEAEAVARGNPAWPNRALVRAYADAADALILDAMEAVDPARGGERGSASEALWTILEHEEMHQETLAYMWHQIPQAQKRKPPLYVTAPPRLARARRDALSVRVPSGPATIGTRDDPSVFAWDNERPAHVVQVPGFSIDVHDVTNAAFLDFVEAGGYADPKWWEPADWAWVVDEGREHPPFWERQPGHGWRLRGMFESVSLPEDWPVYVTWAEASAFARWCGRRLPTEAEFHRAAFGTPEGTERAHSWGEEPAGRPPANVDFARWDPEPVGSHPDGASAFGLEDLIGNGWEWTSTVFGPFSGFAPMPSYPEYSADFFDGQHFVLKGASPVTPRPLLRRGFRNWFRPRYPYVYATFRTAGDA